MGILFGLFLLACIVYAGSYVYEFHKKKKITDRDACFFSAVLMIGGIAIIYNVSFCFLSWLVS